MTEHEPRDLGLRRIVVALDAALHSHVTLELAAALAARKQLELVGLFIEDVNLLHLASLPFAREVDRSSALDRALDEAQISLSFRSQARQISEALHRVSQELRVSSSFEVRRGHFVAAALAAVSAPDVVFLSRRGVASARRPAARRPVWVLYDGSPGAQRALLLGRELSEPDARELAVLLPAADAPALETQARGLLGPAAARTRFSPLPRLAAEEVGRVVSRRGCSAVVLHRDTLAHAEEAAPALLEALDCPLVMVQ